jgi:hypothetical protein
VYDTECDYNREGYPLQYFDTLEERNDFTLDNAPVLIEKFWAGIKKEFMGRDKALVDLYNGLRRLVTHGDIIMINQFLKIATGDTDVDRLVHIINILRPISNKAAYWTTFKHEALKIERIKELKIL